MELELSYGRSGLTFKVPEQAQVTVIRKKPLPVPEDPHTVVAAARTEAGAGHQRQGHHTLGPGGRQFQGNSLTTFDEGADLLQALESLGV